MIEPYPFQTTIIQKVRQAFRDGYTAPLVVSPTGSGKTIIFAIITYLASNKGMRILILVHRQEILEQTLKKLRLLGLTSGQIAAGKPMTRDLVQVAMVSTLVNRLHLVGNFDMIITDEGHHNGAATWMKVYNHFPNALKPLFTATPEMANGRGMGIGQGGIADCLIKGPSLKWAVENGYLAYPFMKGPNEEHVKKIKITRGDFDKDEQVKTMSKKNIVGDAIEHYKQYLDGMPIIVSCVSIKHCYMMMNEYNTYARQSGKEWKAVVVQGGTKYRKQREDGLAGLENGSVQQVMFCDVISEGVDVPLIMGVQNLRRTQSLALILQIWGRALRAVYSTGDTPETKEGRLSAIESGIKPYAMILDHAGNNFIHGSVLDERQWSLEAKSRAQRKKAEPVTTRCPQCSGTLPGKPRKCYGILPTGKRCGFVFDHTGDGPSDARKTPETIRGELVAILPGTDKQVIDEITTDYSRILGMSPAQRQKYMMRKAHEMKARFGDDGRVKIQALANAIGYNPGWSHQAWKIIGKR